MGMETASLSAGLEVKGRVTSNYAEILTPEALNFVARLNRKFSSRRLELLHNRVKGQERWDRGVKPQFLDETAEIRESSWSIEPLPYDLQDRRVEITGPAGDRKMVVNALNSGAKLFMADLEDANSPTWKNTIEGQIHLRDAINREIDFTDHRGKRYQLVKKPAVLIVRPRGWHMEEKHFYVDGAPVSASLFDFGLYFFHNAKTLLRKGSGPYFYLPKVESHLEARLWNDVFVFAQDELKIAQGTIKATVLIETITAAFEMEEILFELKEHSAGLNCGRWDYIFSYIKRFRNHPDVILPDRDQVTMTVPFMRAYTLLAVKTCHKRKAPCIGGMAAQIPVRHDPQANQAALEKVQADKEREALDGHDGTWVAHPALVPVAKAVFDKHMPSPNQIDNMREDVKVTADDLCHVPEGSITEEGLRNNLSVGIQYIDAWLRGYGAAAINHLMEDAATAEIARAQVWQWIRHPEGVLDDGRKVTLDLSRQIMKEELEKIRCQRDEPGRLEEAAALLDQLIAADEFEDFLTVPGYQLLDQD